MTPGNDRPTDRLPGHDRAGDRRPRPNRLNDLTPTDWLKFQKSWFLHNPPPREKGVLVHPAKFPESLIAEFIRFFTKAGQWVLDPMLGTGSTLIAAYEAGRNGHGVELNPKYAEIAGERIAAAKAQRMLDLDGVGATVHIVHQGDARDIGNMVSRQFDYCITSPPYWDMLREKGAETQKDREGAGLDVYYSDDERDLGNVEDFDAFMEQLVAIYRDVARVLKPGGYMTLIVKNVKKGPRMYPLAWRLGIDLSEFLILKDEKVWCQDNIPLFPFGLGSSWVSNTFHNYCLNFQKPAEE